MRRRFPGGAVPGEAPAVCLGEVDSARHEGGPMDYVRSRGKAGSGCGWELTSVGKIPAGSTRPVQVQQALGQCHLDEPGLEVDSSQIALGEWDEDFTSDAVDD
jgi:hypothetical protein